MQELPDFDTMVLMAKNDPDALEQIRQDMSEQIINDAPENFQRRLRGLQFQIDAQRERSSNPVSAMVKIYDMMFNSFETLNESLNGTDGLNTAMQTPQLKAVNDSEVVISQAPPRTAEIIQFKR